MKKFRPLIIFCSFVFLLIVSTSIYAQDNLDETDAPQQKEQGERKNLLRELGLSREQIKKIRELNSQRTPLIKEAQTRLREANRALDQSIYADSIDDSIVELRLKDVQAAQAEVSKIKAQSEFAIRKILTAEQLTKFRELRERFANRLETNRQLRIQRQNKVDAKAPLVRQKENQKP